MIAAIGAAGFVGRNLVLMGQTSEADAAAHLGKSTRQVRRLAQAPRQIGDRAVVHGLTGEPSNHKAPDDFDKVALDTYAKYYQGFGPPLAAQMLEANHHVEVCPETLRRRLLDEGLWARHPASAEEEDGPAPTPANRPLPDRQRPVMLDSFHSTRSGRWREPSHEEATSFNTGELAGAGVSADALPRPGP